MRRFLAARRPREFVTLPSRLSTAAARQAVRRLAVLTAASFALTAVGLLAAPAPTVAWTTGAFNPASELQLVALTNDYRVAAGLRPLTVDPALTVIARARSVDMIERAYFSHQIPPTGMSVFDQMQHGGYCFRLAGENIGWNTYPDEGATAAIHSMFLASPGHLRNVVGATWDTVAVGAYKGPDGKKLWTVLFADRCGAADRGQ